jgi:hypothetical protein
MTIINRPIRLFMALALLPFSQAYAQDTMLDAVMNACEADLAQYCSQVEPGDGRLLYCVAAHGDKIGVECQYALFEAATLLAQYADTILHIAENCETEIDTLCRDISVGEGRILACLDNHEAELGEACATALAEGTAE